MVKKTIGCGKTQDKVVAILLLIFILTLTPIALLNLYFVLTGKILFTFDTNFVIAVYYFLHLMFSGFLVMYAFIKHLPHKIWIPPTINLLIIPASIVGFLLHMFNITFPKIIDLLQLISVLYATVILFKIVMSKRLNRKL